MKIRLSYFLTLAVALAAAAPEAPAGPITSQEAALILQENIPDNDFYMLTQFLGLKPGQGLRLQATLPPTSSWTATLTGAYAGQAVSVTYTGDTTLFPGGLIQWTSTGRAGNSTWAGSGTSLFSNTNPGSLQFNQNSKLKVGGNTGLVGVTNQGTTRKPSLVSNGTTGTITINGSIQPGVADRWIVPQFPVRGDPVYDGVDNSGVVVVNSVGQIIDISPNVVRSPAAQPGTLYLDEMVFVPVPEPSTLALLAAAGLGLIPALRRRRRARP